MAAHVACAPARCGAVRRLARGAPHAAAAAAPPPPLPLHPSGAARVPCRSARCAAGRRGASPAVLEAVRARARGPARAARKRAPSSNCLLRGVQKTKATARTHARTRTCRAHLRALPPLGAAPCGLAALCACAR
jgi:hypothetical protein